jgi:beta-barrel assembly-enhancing protease
MEYLFPLFCICRCVIYYNMYHTVEKEGKIMKHSMLLAAMMLLLLFASTMPCRAAISESQEISMGQSAANQLEAKYGVVNDPTQYERINRIGYALLPACERRNLRFSFKILNTSNINALSLPGGFVYVTKGILPLCTDQELAFVLGHEMAHVAKKHGIKQVEKQMMTDVGLATIVALMSKGQVTQGSKTTTQVLSLIVNSQYSREDENEADNVACQYMVYGPGWNPRSGISFMQKLKKTGGGELPGFVNSLVGSHPLTEERIKAIDDECRKLGY